jgi:ATP-binding cassette subfamily B protein
MQKAIATNQVVSVTPRYAIEAIGISLIAGAAFVLSVGNSEGVSGVVPLLGVMALGAQRLLPMVQQIYSGYITIKGQQASIEDALSLLDQPTRNSAHPRVIKPLPFRRTLALRDLSFRYARDFPFILKSLNLEIMKGTRVGLIGTTGSGKSTLLDVVSGLLTPSQGSLLIDGVQVTNVNTQAWQQQIAHVPQGVFLADSSILENIAFGVPLGEIDIERVKQAAQKAQIAQTINNLSDGYSTMVGERGIRLSGGQRQRIGIARALYKRANVIILDEATSALDNETEEAVIQALESLGRNITIFFIAHRLTTLKNCDRILELDRGNITDLGTYNQMMTKFAQTL